MFPKLLFVILFSAALHQISFGARLASDLRSPSVVNNESPTINSNRNDNSGRTVIVSMKETAKSVLDTLSSQTYSSEREKFNAQFQALKALAQRTQRNVVNFLEAEKGKRGGENQGVTYTSLWITNQVIVKNAKPALIQRLKSFREVSKVEDEKVLQVNAGRG